VNTTAPPWWNKTFGIDPNVPIAIDDRMKVERKFCDGGPWRVPREISRSRNFSYVGALIVAGAGGTLCLILGWPYWTIGIVFIVSVAVLWLTRTTIVNTQLGPLYRRELRARGYDICIQCGYWLRGLGDEVKNCPECGAERDSPR
jgi:hypothetical protein